MFPNRYDSYDRLSTLIATDPESFHLRRFGKLSAKDLLYYQAELVNLEAELEDIVEEDKGSGDSQRDRFPCSVWHLKNSVRPREGRWHGTQWTKCLEIRSLLKEYC